MITAVTHITRYVKDGDEALKFYTEVLGFKLNTDQPMGPGQRWLTVNAPEQPGVEIVLYEPQGWLPPEQAEAALASLDRQPMLCFSTNDIEGLQKKLQEHQVQTDATIGEQPWGRDMSFRDLTGSPIYVVQPHLQAVVQ